MNPFFPEDETLDPAPPSADPDGPELPPGAAGTRGAWCPTPASPLPGDVFALTTGPASQCLRRACGGTAFWETDPSGRLLRSLPPKAHHERVYAVAEPAHRPAAPVLDRSDPDARAAAHALLKDVWEGVARLGPDEADWFDLIVALHLGNNGAWRARAHRDPRTWVVVPISALKQARAKGRPNGFRDTAERHQHHGALLRLLELKLAWESAPPIYQKGGGRDVFGYFDWARHEGEADLWGRLQVHSYRVFPTWWFETEMAACGGHTGMYFEAGLRQVLQIPPNKTIAKAVARYLVGGFWRQRATQGRGYALTLSELHDRAGIGLPDWAGRYPKRYAERFADQLRQIGDAGAECALLAPPVVAPADGTHRVLERWLSQPIELRPHAEAPALLWEAIRYLEARGARQSQRHEQACVQAEARRLAGKRGGRA